MIGTLLVINITAVIGGIFIGWWLRSVTMQDHSMVGGRRRVTRKTPELSETPENVGDRSE